MAMNTVTETTTCAECGIPIGPAAGDTGPWLRAGARTENGEYYAGDNACGELERSSRSGVLRPMRSHRPAIK